MNRLIVIALIFAVLVFASPAHAAGWSANVRIKSIEISNVSTAGTWLAFTTPPFSGPTCKNSNGQFLVGGGADNVNKITSLAIQAMSGGRPVSIYWGGNCSAGYPIVLGLTVR